MEKENDWKGDLDYFQAYDIFQLNSSRYNQMLRLHLDELEGFEKILENGCGTGNLSQELLKKGQQVNGIDITPIAIYLAREKCSSYSSPENFVLGNSEKASQYFNPEQFDALSSMIVLPFPDVGKYLTQSYNVLKPGGKFVITSWACVEDLEAGIMGSLEEELIEKGILPKFQKNWEDVKTSVTQMTPNIIHKNLTLSNLIEELTNAKFQDILLLESPYGKYAYSLTCRK